MPKLNNKCCGSVTGVVVARTRGKLGIADAGLQCLEEASVAASAPSGLRNLRQSLLDRHGSDQLSRHSVVAHKTRLVRKLGSRQEQRDQACPIWRTDGREIDLRSQSPKQFLSCYPQLLRLFLRCSPLSTGEDQLLMLLIAMAAIAGHACLPFTSCSVCLLFNSR